MVATAVGRSLSAPTVACLSFSADLLLSASARCERRRALVTGVLLALVRIFSQWPACFWATQLHLLAQRGHSRVMCFRGPTPPELDGCACGARPSLQIALSTRRLARK